MRCRPLAANFDKGCFNMSFDLRSSKNQTSNKSHCAEWALIFLNSFFKLITTKGFIKKFQNFFQNFFVRLSSLQMIISYFTKCQGRILPNFTYFNENFYYLLRVSKQPFKRICSCYERFTQELKFQAYKTIKFLTYKKNSITKN